MPEVVEVDDCGQELVPLTRHEIPKRRLNNKYFQRYRDVYKGEGDVVKVIVLEGYEPYQMTHNQKEKLFQKIQNEAKDINYGMDNFSMDYSLGKRKRWELASVKASQLPELPEFCSSISVLKFSEDRTMHQRCDRNMRHNRGQIYAFHNENPCYRYWHATLNSFAVKTENAIVDRKGKFNCKQRILEMEENPTELKIHVQYHVTDMKMNRKTHNSEKYRFWYNSKDQFYRKGTEGCRPHQDVIRLADGSYYTGVSEFNGYHYDLDDLEIEEVDDEVEIPKARGITFADFLVPKIKKQRKRTTSDQWVLV